MPLHIDAFGPDALLVRFAAQGDRLAFARGQALMRYLDQRPPAGLVEVTPGFTTMLLEFEPGHSPDSRLLTLVLERAIRGVTSDEPPVRTVEIPVVYDGPDLERVAAHAGLSIEEVAGLHASGSYRVHLLGFAPGFPYLVGLDPRLHVPRLATPRLRVPTGSVAIGGEYTGVYPVSTAGGWNLIGRTSVAWLDPARAAAGDPEAFLVRPGDAVRFVRMTGGEAT